MVFDQVFRIGIFAVQVPILGPRPFGLVAIVMVFIGFCEFVLDDAMTDALISVKDIKDLHYQTMTTLNIVMALAMGVLFLAGADRIAKAFGDPDLAPLTRVMAVIPLISAFSAAPRAATVRDMQFQRTATRSIAAITVAGIAGLILTLTGAGVWALVWQAVIQRVVGAYVLRRIVPIKFRLVFSRPHYRDLHNFFATVMLARIMHWGNAQVPRLIFGWFLGPTDLGLLSLATRLYGILTQVTVESKSAVARVELRRFQADPGGLDAAIRKLVLQASIIFYPAAIGLAAVTPTLFHAWLEPRWYPAILPTQLILALAPSAVTFYVTTATMLALNQQAAEAFIAVMMTGFAAVVALVSGPFGLVAAAIGLAIQSLVILPLPVIQMSRRCGIRPRTLLAPQAAPLAASLIMGIGVMLASGRVEHLLGSLGALPVLIGIGAVLYGWVIAILMPDFTRDTLAWLSRRLNRARDPRMDG